MNIFTRISHKNNPLHFTDRQTYGEVPRYMFMLGTDVTLFLNEHEMRQWREALTDVLDKIDKED